MSQRKHRRDQLVEKRKERAETTYNGKRKKEYSAMGGVEGVLGHKELAKYETFRTAIRRKREGLERMGISIPNLPTENITKSFYDLAKNFYYTYVCPRCEDEESLEVAEEPNNFFVEDNRKIESYLI
jgi:hypothetical protein